VTIGPDGSKIVEFRAPSGKIGINEPFYVHAEGNSSNCGDVSGYNHPEYVPEYIDLYISPCGIS
jgi:hypothetical protein